MADISWKAPTVALSTYLSTELNSLANSTLKLGAEINNETNLCMYMDIELVLGSVDVSAQASPAVQVHRIDSVDGGTTYDSVTDGSSTDAAHPQGKIMAILPIRKGSGAEAKSAIRTIIQIPPGRFKLAVLNQLGVAFAASGNTLKYRTYKVQSA